MEDGEERVVVGSLDLNQCLWLPDELTGKRPGVSLLLPFFNYMAEYSMLYDLLSSSLGYSGKNSVVTIFGQFCF